MEFRRVLFRSAARCMGGRVVFGRYNPNELEMSMLLLRSSVSDIMPPQRRLVNAYERRAGVSSWADRRRGAHRRDVCEGEDKWRSEERRVGKECVRPCRARCAPSPKKKKK